MPYDLYPAVDANYDFAPEVRVALSKSLELRNTVVPMTTVLRNNLTAAEKWDGRLIVNTDTDRIERYDATALQWFEIAEAASLATDYVRRDAGTMLADPTVPLGVVTKQYADKYNVGPSGFRNVIRNGDFSIAQRGDGPWTVDGVGPDGFSVWRSGGTVSVTRSIPVGESPQLVVAISGQAAATDYTQVIIPVEGVGTLAGRTVTVSFLAKASSGAPKIGVRFTQMFGTGGSPSTPVEVSPASLVTLSTTMTRYTYTITLPSIAGKVIGTSGGDYLRMGFWLSAGANQTTSGGVPIQNNTFSITDIQLEEGPVATPFERLPIQQQLAWCQRYFQRHGTMAMRGVFSGVSTASRIGAVFPVQFRGNPTVSYTPSVNIFDGGASGTVSAIANNYTTWRNVEMDVTSSANTHTAGRAAVLYAGGVGYFDFSAEL